MSREMTDADDLRCRLFAKIDHGAAVNAPLRYDLAISSLNGSILLNVVGHRILLEMESPAGIGDQADDPDGANERCCLVAFHSASVTLAIL